MSKLLLDDYDKLQVRKDGDAYFICGPDFVDLQTSPVVWYSIDTPDGLVLHQWFGVVSNPIIHLSLTEICWIIEKLNRDALKGGEE